MSESPSKLIPLLQARIAEGVLLLLKGEAELKFYDCVGFHANANSERSWPGLKLIVTETGLSESSVYRAERSLKKKRLIEVLHATSNRPKTYKVLALNSRHQQEIQIKREASLEALRTEWKRQGRWKAETKNKQVTTVEGDSGKQLNSTVVDNSVNGDEPLSRETVSPLLGVTVEPLSQVKQTTVAPDSIIMKEHKIEHESEFEGENRKRDSSEQGDGVGGRDNNLNLSNDDDQMLRLRGEIPDTAGPDAIAEALKRRGVDGGRAHTRSQRGACTPELVREVLANFETNGHRARNRGGYLGGLIDDALKQAAEQMRREQAEAEHLRAIEHETAANSIDDLTDDELHDAIKGHSNLVGLAESEGWANIRGNKIFRSEAARSVARWQREQRAEPVQVGGPAA